MSTLNLHNTVAEALSSLNPWKIMTFTKTFTEWSIDSREPTITTEKIELQGKIQPANNQDVIKLGFDVNSYQYYRVFISADITQIDRLRQLGSDTFVLDDGTKYRMVAKNDWIQNGWREGFCYLEEEDG